MRHALARADLGAFLAVLRGAAGLSQIELANLVEGWSQSTVSNIERNERRTLYDIQELLRVADAVDMPREALLPLVLGSPDATLGEDHNVVFEPGNELNRRRFHEMAAGLAIPAVLPQIQIPDKVGTAHVRYLRNCAERLYRRDQSIGGAGLLRQAVRQFHRARQMLEDSEYNTSTGQQLLAVAGDLAVCGGWLAFDAGDCSLARRLYSEALVLAGNADDATLTTHVLTNMSMLSSYVARTTGRRGVAREGLRLADQAADVARHERSPRLHALIALRRANAASLVGEDLSFRASITRARRELDRGPHDDDPEWIRFVSDAEITGHEAMGRLNLGDTNRGEQLYRLVLAEEISPRNHAYYGALLTGALWAKGNQADALDHALSVLPAFSDGVTSIRTLNELRPIRAAAATTAEEFCLRFDSVAASLAS